MLEARKIAGERQRRHHHPLKGTLWCGACQRAGTQRRMILQRAKGVGGVYFYFFCRGRQEHDCEQPYLNVERVEEAVADHYASIRFTPAFISLVRRIMRETVEDDQSSTTQLRKQLATQLQRLDTQESNLIELAAETTGARRKVRQKLIDIERERDRLRERLAATENELATGAELLNAALDLLERPDELYCRATDAGRRAINQALFEKLYIDRDAVSNDETRSPFAELVATHRAQAGGDNLRTGVDRTHKRRKPDRNHRGSNPASWCTRAALLGPIATRPGRPGREF